MLINKNKTYIRRTSSLALTTRYMLICVTKFGKLTS